MVKFKNIGITGREGFGVGDSLKVLTSFLAKKRVKVFISDLLAPMLTDCDLPEIGRAHV